MRVLTPRPAELPAWDSLSADEKRLYVAVGSATNVDEERIDEKEPQRAAILIGPPGSGKSHLVEVWRQKSAAALRQERPIR